MKSTDKQFTQDMKTSNKPVKYEKYVEKLPLVTQICK